jgi:hypothetical protein
MTYVEHLLASKGFSAERFMPHPQAMSRHLSSHGPRGLQLVPVGFDPRVYEGIDVNLLQRLPVRAHQGGGGAH